MRGFSLSVAATLLALSITGQTGLVAKEPLVLQPSSNWNLDYADDKCRLMRRFGEGENSVEFLLEQAGPEPFYTMALFGEPARGSNRETMRIQFGPSEEMSERSFLSGKLKGKDTRFVIMHGIHLAAPPKGAKQGEFVVVDIGPDREQAITTLSLKHGVRHPLTLQLGSMGEPMAAMRTCIADLMEAIGPVEDDPNGKGKKANLTNIKKVARFIQERYPMRMIKKEQGGVVGVRLMVNREGKASACQITKSDRPAAFDDMVCFGLLKIAEFEPALGPDGEPRIGTYTTSVRYEVN